MLVTTSNVNFQGKKRKNPKRETTKPKPDKIGQISNHATNRLARSFCDGTMAHGLQETPKKIKGRVAYGGAGLFTSSVVSAIPEMLKQIKRQGIRILTLGDGRGTDALSIQLERTAHFLKGKSLSSIVSKKELIDHLSQIVIHRLDLHSFTKEQENRAFSTPILKRDHQFPDLMTHLRGSFSGSPGPNGWFISMNSIPDQLAGKVSRIEADSFLEEKETRKILLGDTIQHDLRSENPLPPSEITSIGQLLHYFQTVPPRNVDPHKEIPMSERANVIKKITTQKPKFILLADNPAPETQKANNEGIQASFLSEGYVPDRILIGKYGRSEEQKKIAKQYRDNPVFPQYAIYRYGPIQAEARRGKYAEVIQRAWRTHKFREAFSNLLKT